jgi:hypothetical protein
MLLLPLLLHVQLPQPSSCCCLGHCCLDTLNSTPELQSGIQHARPQPVVVHHAAWDLTSYCFSVL